MAPTSTPIPGTSSVTGFTLINGSNNTDLRPIVNYDVFNLRTLPTTTLRLRANLSPSTTGSVVFGLTSTLTGQSTTTNPAYSTDNAFEYRLGTTWAALPGQYVLTATPYTGSNGTGTAGQPLTIHFTVMDYVMSAPTVTSSNVHTRAVATVGATIFKDRSYTITQIDPVLAGKDFIQAWNNDKTQTGSSFMTFTLRCASTVYVGYDSRITTLPTWLQSWTPTNLVFEAQDDIQARARTVYSKSYPAGSVTLGANNGATANYTYTVIIAPTASCN